MKATMEKDQDHAECIIARLDELTRRVDDNREHCDHGRGNLYNIVKYCFDQVSEINGQFTYIKSSIEESIARAEKVEAKLLH